MATQRIQLKRGLFENLPTSTMLPGEPLVTTDRGTLHLATDPTTKLAVSVAVDELASLPAIATEDMLMVHDASEAAGQMEKKLTFGAFKAALNIPAGSSDAMVAVVAGGTAGYIWGTDGTDGILQMGSSMKMTKDPSNGFVTIDVEVVDGGTF